VKSLEWIRAENSECHRYHVLCDRCGRVCGLSRRQDVWSRCQSHLEAWRR